MLLALLMTSSSRKLVEVSLMLAPLVARIRTYRRRGLSACTNIMQWLQA